LINQSGAAQSNKRSAAPACCENDEIAAREAIFAARPVYIFQEPDYEALKQYSIFIVVLFTGNRNGCDHIADDFKCQENSFITITRNRGRAAASVFNVVEHEGIARKVSN
jgi:hypothetical protein